MEYKEYLIENLGFDYKETGDNIMYNCPFCNDHKHDYKLSFKKSTDSSNGIWQCWRCGRKGNFIGFVMKYE
ncbi:CHC2 zinc finger domain-containing protein, partial [Salmonella enterica]|uniref:CHC2 zinc finger domain-containing protein n=1 Tax=Salmonella enterica TaxID=28901 RepID=UPI000CC246F8